MTQLADTYGAQYFSGTGSITVGMIPEPSVGLLLMLGIAGLGLLKMYRQKRREGMKMNKAIICPIS
jgi:hypothetical protein